MPFYMFLFIAGPTLGGLVWLLGHIEKDAHTKGMALMVFGVAMISGVVNLIATHFNIEFLLR